MQLEKEKEAKQKNWRILSQKQSQLETIMEMYQHENFFARKQSIKQAEREQKSRAEVFDKDNLDLKEKIAAL